MVWSMEKEHRLQTYLDLIERRSKNSCCGFGASTVFFLNLIERCCKRIHAPLKLTWKIFDFARERLQKQQMRFESLRQYCSSTISVLFQYFSSTVPVLHQYYSNTVSILFQYCCSNAPVLFQWCSNTVPVQYQYCSSTISVLSQYSSIL